MLHSEYWWLVADVSEQHIRHIPQGTYILYRNVVTNNQRTLRNIPEEMNRLYQNFGN